MSRRSRNADGRDVPWHDLNVAGSDISIVDRLIPGREYHTPGISYGVLTAEQTAIVHRVNEAIEARKIAYEVVPCLCGATSFDLLGSADHFGIRQYTVCCRHCGMVMSNPRMTHDEYTTFYSSDVYRTLYSGHDYLETLRRERYDESTGRHIFDACVICRPIPPGIRVLEVGAGGGWNLIPFQRAGCNVLGLDYSPTLVDMGVAVGVPMVQGGLEKVSGQFDLIILSHVLEHFLAPLDVLRRLCAHLADGGMFYIEVPNILNFSRGQLQAAHTYYFSPRTLIHALHSCGLRAAHTRRARQIHISVVAVRGDNTSVPTEAEYRMAVTDFRTVIGRERRRERIRSFLRSVGLLRVLRKIRGRK